MRRLLMLGALAGCLTAAPGLAATPAKAPPVAGTWALAVNHVRLRLGPCGKAAGSPLCGWMVSADKLRQNPRLKDKMNRDPKLRGRPVAGMLLLSGFVGGPPKWTHGHVYNPDDGRTYSSEMTLVGADTLKVSGCVIKPLCKSETLTRVR